MTTRPHRHLCPEADLRDGMTADDYWHHIYDNDGWRPSPDPVHDGPAYHEVCTVCGSFTECGNDAEGRPMFHATEPEDA